MNRVLANKQKKVDDVVNNQNGGGEASKPAVVADVPSTSAASKLKLVIKSCIFS